MTAIYRPTATFYHSCDGVASTCERLTTPLQYHIHRGDLVAFRKELRSETNGGNQVASLPLLGSWEMCNSLFPSYRSGASTLVTDRLGRTALCVLIQKLEDFFVTALCTSLAVDDLVQTFRTEALFPAKFAIHTHEDITANLYALQQEKLYQAEAANGAIHCPSHIDGRLKRVYPQVPAHPLCHCGLPSHAFDPAPGRRGVEPHALNEKYFQQTMLVAVEDAINKPMAYKTQYRLCRMAREIKAYLDLMQELVSCDLLVHHTLERRRGLLLSDQKAYTKAGTSDSKEGLWLRGLTIPYLYTVCLRILFELNPLSPDGTKWNPKAPSDARCLVGIVCKLELPGYQVLLFMADVCQLLCSFLCSLPGGFFHPPRPVFQYLAHMAFVLDCPAFFQVLAVADRDACFDSAPFDWRGTLAELKACCGSKMEAFVAPLEQRLVGSSPLAQEPKKSEQKGDASSVNVQPWLERPMRPTTSTSPATLALPTSFPATALPGGPSLLSQEAADAQWPRQCEQ